MQQYPYSQPMILTDYVAILYGLHTGTSSNAQRQVAYLLAEEQMTEYLSSFIVPTTVTGTYFWKGSNPVVLDYGHINQILSVSINSWDWLNGCTVDSVSGCYGQRNDEYGYLDVLPFLQCGGCGSIVGLAPYHITVAYNSGLQTGTSTQPAMLMALTIVSQINLNELDVSLSNEGTADIGIESFSNQQYNEKRYKLGSSAFGNSPMANRAARLVKKYRSRPGIGWK